MFRQGKKVILSLFAIGVLMLMGLSPATEQGDRFSIASAKSGQLEVGDVNIVPLQVTGPASERLNLIILGDGYTADEMDKFHEDVDRNQNVQWSVEPFRSYRNYFNVYMVETPSKESGISCDPDDGNVRRDTVFHLQYANECPADPLARGVTYGAGGVEARDAILRDHVAPLLGIPEKYQNIQTIVIANTFTYGGIGGVHATTTGGSPQGPLVSLHELGHSLGQLQDEYPYSSREYPGLPHPNSEPSSLHHTRMSSEEMMAQKAKWWRWLGEESESGGMIRAADPDGYESGSTRGSNVWRPSEHSMMRWTGFYFDQVGREIMTQRITGMRNANKMPVNSTPEGEVGTEDVLWVETMHPRFHMLDVTWEINGKRVADTNNSRYLELGKVNVKKGDSIKATVKDTTEFVRDPAYLDGPRMTQAREWTVGAPLPKKDVEIQFTNHSTTLHHLTHDEIVFVETANPVDRVLQVTWEINGKKIEDKHDTRHLDLSQFNLPKGSFELKATVMDPLDSGGGSDTVGWTVDNELPLAEKTLSDPLAMLGTEHYVYFNEFDMLLDPKDNQSGFVVGEFRLNKDGWYNYFGFPDAPLGTPFTFSHSGTVVKALVYGNLGTGGLSKAAFEQTYNENDPGGPFVAGFGTHLVEHRAIDAAGNIGLSKNFHVTVLPGGKPACSEKMTGKHPGNVVVKDGVVCIEDAEVSGGLTVQGGASIIVSNSTIHGAIESINAERVQIVESTVQGKTTVMSTKSDVSIVGSSFNGSLALLDNNQVSVNEKYGEYGPVVVGNSVHGTLISVHNNAKVADFGAPNKASGTSDINAQDILSFIKHFEVGGEFSNPEAARALKTHMIAVELFEEKGEDEKVLQHMGGFETLLNNQQKNQSISEKAGQILNAFANEFVKKVES
ncbi:M64 family metallopeptidase [Siminovitchia sp. FSL H7-0308]|uniref:M64 family metallopeptidase n=1 Tax=Siminovitchia sp. FSL H7-0308 TaxID=2921432 RepID=UPI0030EF59E3